MKLQFIRLVCSISPIFKYHICNRIYLPGSYGEYAAFAWLWTGIGGHCNGFKTLQHQELQQKVLSDARLRLAC